MIWKACACAIFVAALSGDVLAGPTGLNVIPTTDLTPLKNWILGLQNGNTSLSGLPLYRRPSFTFQSEYGLDPITEIGFDYIQTPDLGHDAIVFNGKIQVLSEDDYRPNMAIGAENITLGQAPTYYVTFSKTLNYAEEQEERFRAHHRRNRKLLGQRVHLGMMLDGHGVFQPFAGTDLQLSESLVFQADYIHGSGNAVTAGLSYVFPDQRTVFNPAILFFNDTRRLGLSIAITRQFGS